MSNAVTPGAVVAWKWVESPIGRLTLLASDSALVGVLFDGKEPPSKGRPLDGRNRRPRHGVLVEAERQVTEYFSGDRDVFDVSLLLEGTAFQRRVWEALIDIPYGETVTYGELAASLGGVGKARAVGAACGRNPVPVIVPCHRVIGRSGSLRGFGGGLDVKAFLLRLEGQRRRGAD